MVEPGDRQLCSASQGELVDHGYLLHKYPNQRLSSITEMGSISHLYYAELMSDSMVVIFLKPLYEIFADILKSSSRNLMKGNKLS